MAGFGLRKNMVFDWKGATFRIDRLQPDGEVLLESISGGTLSLVQRQQLLDDYANGLVSATTATEQSPHAMPSYSRPLDQLSQETQRETKRRRSYLEAISADGKPVFTPDYVVPIIQQVAEKIGDDNPPSATSVYRWHKRLILADDTRALVPRYDLRGAKKMLRSTRVHELLAEAVAEAFNATPLATGQNIYSRLLAKVDIENRRSLSSTPCVAPSDRTVYRMLAKVDLYEMTVLKEGKASADRRFRVGKAGVKPTRILERIEIDHTPLDLFLVDERTWLPLGRPTLTVAIDTFSRMLWGYYLSYGPPSVPAVIGAMRHGILPKPPTEYAIEGLAVEHRWPTYGIPETLVADNGLEFLGNDLESVAIDLGFHIEFCPKRQPRFKGTVERYLKTINYNFAHQIPGASFARFHLRGDYDPQKYALLTLAEFKHLFEKWVVDVYAQTKHSGIGTTPWHRWHEGMAKAACVSPSVVRHMVQGELVPSSSVALLSGRHARSIHVSELPGIRSATDGALSLELTARVLSLPERRVRELILGGLLTPLVSRQLNGGAAAWLIPKREVDRLHVQASQVKDSSKGVTVRDVLKYWRLREHEGTALVAAVVDGRLQTAGESQGIVPVGAAVLSAAEARQWLLDHRVAARQDYSVDEAAKVLGIKQQVAYDLVRSGLLRSTTGGVLGHRVSAANIERFQATYVSLASLANEGRRSPRALLVELSATPVCGPAIDGARQYFYRRSEVETQPNSRIS